MDIQFLKHQISSAQSTLSEEQDKGVSQAIKPIYRLLEDTLQKIEELETEIKKIQTKIG